ncbi:hypothetical protein P280DRAFT_393712 [Massarina eburnea CBS 473.64]|uniref:DUF7703 domain-containing protein n=1 Tax=Massarina eburnea CBS 473.64 TaxID=1395130 RepID=A0A6A6S5P4_9PLEO|nr:hypothetical protein P280DRAFT_393712 [Massarina eburnea CBS 473.64]
MNSDLNHYHGEWNFDTIAVVVCSSISSYNAVELILLILTTFTHYRGLYFWSLTVASLGIIPYVFGYLVEYFNWTHLSVGIAIDTTGWILMVSGQALVLYSRLWIMFSEGSRRFLAIPKWMIIINAIVLHGMTAVAVYGSHFTQGSTKDRFGEAYDKVERIQMCLFCAQEFVLSGLYIWKAVDMLNTSNRERARHLTWQLFSINVFIIALDIGLLAIEFSGQHVLQQTVKGVTYSVKLKLELSILSKIKELSHSSTSTSFGPTNGFVVSSADLHTPPRLSLTLYLYA